MTNLCSNCRNEIDGGPAFPGTKTGGSEPGCEVTADHPGMSLREWYAGQALSALLSRADLDASEVIDRSLVRRDLVDEALIYGKMMVGESIAATARAAAQPQPAEERTDKCAMCEGTFPEAALNYSSGDPACAPCQKAFVEEAKSRRYGS